MKRIFTYLLVALFLMAFSATLYAEVKFSYGGAFRLRQELWEDAFDVNNDLGSGSLADRNFFRLRTQLWGRADLSENAGAYLRLVNEAKYYIGPYKPNMPRNDDRLDEDELLIDNLYVDLKNIAGLPVDLRLGRQDLIYGEGFLVLDGTPGDGSRTIYFNAAKLTLKLNDGNSFDVVYLFDPKKDRYLPSLYPNEKKTLNTSDEEGVIVYGKNKITENITIEPYYIYKKEEEWAQPELKLNTLGLRAVFTQDNWKLRGEFAHQFGEYEGGRDRTGNGGYIFVGRQYKDIDLKPEWDLGYVYLSGDDPDTAKHEGWNPLFSRWPMYSELYILTYTKETPNDSVFPAYWTNLQLYRANLKLNFSDATYLSLWYNYLRANEETRGLPTNIFSNDGKTRGHLYQAKLYQRVDKNLDGYILAEYFDPKDFYADGADNALFFRWEIQYKF